MNLVTFFNSIVPLSITRTILTTNGKKEITSVHQGDDHVQDPFKSQWFATWEFDGIMDGVVHPTPQKKEEYVDKFDQLINHHL
jgi:hypothetical protein